MRFPPLCNHAADLVSPCPEDTTCVWSGIVTNSGTYSVNATNTTINLAYTTANTLAGSVTLPTRLEIDASSEGRVTLAEVLADGSYLFYFRAP